MLVDADAQPVPVAAARLGVDDAHAEARADSGAVAVIVGLALGEAVAVVDTHALLVADALTSALLDIDGEGVPVKDRDGLVDTDGETVPETLRGGLALTDGLRVGASDAVREGETLGLLVVGADAVGDGVGARDADVEPVKLAAALLDGDGDVLAELVSIEEADDERVAMAPDAVTLGVAADDAVPLAVRALVAEPDCVALAEALRVEPVDALPVRVADAVSLAAGVAVTDAQIVGPAGDADTKPVADSRRLLVAADVRVEINELVAAGEAEPTAVTDVLIV